MPIRPLTQQLIDEYVAAGVWQERPLHRIIEGRADTHADKLALTCGTDRLTYGELVSAYQALGSWLLEQGLEPDDVVALQAPNHVALPIVHLACNYAGVRLVPLALAFRRQEMEHLLKVGEAKVVIVPAADDHDYLEVVREASSDLPHLRLIGELDGSRGDFSLAAITRGAPTLPARNEDPNASTFCMITSGTTGLSRISLFTDNDLWGMLDPYRDAVGMIEDDVAVGIAPANTGSTGYIFPVLTSLLFGASAVLIDHWRPHTALDLLEETGATIACAIPTQIIKMLQHPDFDTHDFGSLRVFSNAGAPLAPESAAELEDMFGCKVQTIYGSTDGGVPVMTWHDDPAEKRQTTVGRLLPHTDLRLVDADMNDVEQGTPGEILWRNGTKTFAYLNNEEHSTAAFTSDGFYRSGDLGALDGDRYLRIVGRVKDMILRGGQNISPREIEDILATHPAISEVSIIGVPDKVFGEKTCACVVPKHGVSIDLESITQFLLERSVEMYKFPEYIEVFDALPTNQGAKVSKVALRTIVVDRRQASASR